MEDALKSKIAALVACVLSISGFILVSLPIEVQVPENLITLTPSQTMLGAGAKWAANGGNKALYVNWVDYSIANPKNPTEFNPPKEAAHLVSAVINSLEYYGMIIKRSPKIPSDLSPYDVVVIDCYWACSPSSSPLLSKYVSNGGGVVLISGTPPYLVVDCNTTHPLQNDLSKVKEWLGASYYYNSNGNATISIKNPLGTTLLLGQVVFTGLGSQASVYSLQKDATPLAFWDHGGVFAYTYEYGHGRVYYQASHD